ncbi:MAG: helix-turn-helix domain-containing protein [Acidipropionibacterium jensenii]|nr:helix-turn-helix domain-containing protein [Acidipropionibacterium jensenii]MDN5997419.1 helix-turn-helix domain-containing protein [Acidipropionibacterium jensenii]MDN6512176.1 helix-turn-helix domain-containing protein [Acidipropionibacterium jensenii]MDN6810724.1 helix-turn-helix domain-containing protein [Acidipropionibacterium jensenii]
MEQRTVGTTFVARDGREYRPSMFVTLTLPSYGPVIPGVDTPADPSTYNYRRAALDALLFPKLVDQFWKALRRCAGYNVQYFSAIEPQKRLAPHLHAAVRGTIPRQVLRQVVRAVYLQVWWPPIDSAVYTTSAPVWMGTGYADPMTGELLPTWEDALDRLEAPGARPMHVMRFGAQVDARGIVAPSVEADRAVRYLTKYLTKSVAETYGDELSAAREAHIERMHRELRFLPCSEKCANWLRYGVQPKDAVPGLVPGRCQHKAHDREMLGLGGRRVLVSRKWSGKTLAQHRADRQTVVHAVLEEAGFTTPEIDRLAAETQMEDGRRRFTWGERTPQGPRLPACHVGEHSPTAGVATVLPPRQGTNRAGGRPIARAATLGATAATPTHLARPSRSIVNVKEFERLLTTAEVAKIVQVSPSTLCRWRQQGVGPRVTWLSRSIPRYAATDVEKWLQKAAA